MSSSAGRVAARVLGLLLVVLAPPAAALAATGGGVEGRVVFTGPVPAAPPIPVDPRHHEACGAQAPNEALVVDPRTRGVRSAVAYLEAAPAGEAAPETRVLENRDCRFVPRVLAARVGDTLRVRNADPVLHNIRGREVGQTRSLINVVQPTQGQETDREVRKAGVLSITCDTHPHMQAYLLAFEHPHFTLTDGEGRFRLTGVPPGRYRLVVWHEGWRVLRLERGRPVYDDPRVVLQEVTVPAGGIARVQVELSEGTPGIR